MKRIDYTDLDAAEDWGWIIKWGGAVVFVLLLVGATLAYFL